MDTERTKLTGVILAGGRGERFWPLSRFSRPKQLLKLFGEKSMLCDTWNRLAHRLENENIWILAGDDLKEVISADLPRLLPERLVLETEGKNTAPALAVAAALALRDNQDPIQLVVPSDHWIPDLEAFWSTIDKAIEVLEGSADPLVTLGIPISRPDTGYGYIEKGQKYAELDQAWQVRCFHEKPDLDTAKDYLKSGAYFWNSGIFLWRASRFLDEVRIWMPELHSQVADLITASDPAALLSEIFHRVESQSVDFGILEKSKQVSVVAAEFSWSDVGTWESWANLAARDEAGNSACGDVICLETENCAFYSDDGVIAALGVKDLVVVRAGNVTMVAPRDKAQEVRKLIGVIREGSDKQKDLL